MKYGPWCLGACLLGVVLMAASWIWGSYVGSSAMWSEEEAKTLAASAARFHAAAHERMHGPNDSHGHAHSHVHLASLSASSKEAEYHAAEADWKLHMQERDAAIAWRDFWERVLFGGGVVAVIAGGIGYLALRNQAD